MKYLDRYIEEKMKIKVLGELTTNGSVEGDCVGVSLVIDGYEPGIEVWYVDYANWLEEKIEGWEKRLESSKITGLSSKLEDLDKIEGWEKRLESEMKLDDFLSEATSTQENKIDNSEKYKIEYKDFRREVMAAMKNKPEQWRDGQFVFNYIDEIYGVARHVQFVEGVDCFYDDTQIEPFIKACYQELTK